MTICLTERFGAFFALAKLLILKRFFPFEIAPRWRARCFDEGVPESHEEATPMKTMPHVRKFMTPMPHTIEKGIPLKKALEEMRLHAVRHLPVLDEHGLVGILTDRDVKLAASFNGATEMVAGDVMTPDLYVVVPDAPLDQVVFEMAEHKYGCAVVRQENGKVVGIFTATDGLRVLGEVLGGAFKRDALDSKVRSQA